MDHNYESYKNAIESSCSMAEAAVKLNLHFGTFKRYAIKFGLYAPNQSGKGIKKKKSTTIQTKNILQGKHPSYQTFKLKTRLLQEKIFENKCKICGISTWNGKELKCELDHINGNRHDHRLENLRLLCPNCHSQTDTYCAKNIK